MVESLEFRKFLSGVVEVVSGGGQVTIVGDGAANRIRISQFVSEDGSPSGGFTITAFAGTTLVVDGQPVGTSFTSGRGDITSAFVTKPLAISLGGGGDRVDVEHFTPAERLFVDLGTGNDVANLSTASETSIDVAIGVLGGDGDDRISFSGGCTNLTVFPGIGRDGVAIRGDPVAFPRDGRVSIAGRLQIQDTQGPTSVSLLAVDLTQAASIVTGNSVDRVTLDRCSFRRPLVLTTHGGNDVLIGISNRFRAGGIVAPGAGNDFVQGFDELL